MTAADEFPRLPVGSVEAEQQRLQMIEEIDRLRAVLDAAEAWTEAWGWDEPDIGIHDRADVRLFAAVRAFRSASSPSLPTDRLGVVPTSPEATTATPTLPPSR